MPNNQAKIREANALLESGVDSVTLPNGQSTHFNHETIERERRRLQQDDDNAQARRPVVARINLSGASA